MRIARMLSLLAIAFALVLPTLSQHIVANVKYGGKKYAFDGSLILEWPATFTSRAYQIMGETQTATFVLNGPANAGAIPASSFVIDDTLYQFKGLYGDGYLVKYALPFTRSPVSPIATLTFASHVQLGSTVVNEKDGIAIALITRYINVVNLTTFAITDTHQAVFGSGKRPGAIVYDERDNHIYYFQTNYCAWGFCQHIYEYRVTATGQILDLPETFSANYSVNFNNGGLTGCKLDKCSNGIWCLNADMDTLVRFSIANLNLHTFFPLPSRNYTDDNVAFDFTNKVAYVVFDRPAGFGVLQISLTSGAVLKSKSFAAGSPVVSVALMNENKEILHLGLEVEGLPNPHLVIVDMGDLTATELTLAF